MCRDLRVITNTGDPSGGHMMTGLRGVCPLVIYCVSMYQSFCYISLAPEVNILVIEGPRMVGHLLSHDRGSMSKL